MKPGWFNDGIKMNHFYWSSKWKDEENEGIITWVCFI